MALGHSILLVEDDEIVRFLTADVLEDLGYHVCSAETPSQALALVQSEPTFDLVLTDINLPEMSGIELAVAIRNIHPNIPILLASGYLDPSSFSDAHPLLQDPRLSSPVALISKPFTIAHLRSIVGDLLGNNFLEQSLRKIC